MKHVVIIGAGMGGLTAAIRLAQRGVQVTVIEARQQAGGLAAASLIDGFRFDTGPYILLDRLGLEWSFSKLGIDLQQLELLRIPHVYEMETGNHTLRIGASVEETAAGIEQTWPGCGARYRQLVRQLQARFHRLQPLQFSARPRIRDLFRTGAWRDLPFLLRTLDSVLRDSKLPQPVIDGLAIWTAIAGQSSALAPSTLGLVPAVIHEVGAYYPRQGIGSIPEVLFKTAQNLGVRFRFGTLVRHIQCQAHSVVGVELSENELIQADDVISNVGLGTYLTLLDEVGKKAIPNRIQRSLGKLPLQSPGVCAYLAVKGDVGPAYLRFHIQNERDGCRLFVRPSVLDPSLSCDGWVPAKLIAPLSHRRAREGGEAEQRSFLAHILAENWWQKNLTDFRVLATRIPQDWGTAYHLYQDSMNPVMTAKFMRAGRLAHRSPWIRGLYLTGSATHPGQWVSFCAISGVLTADQLLDDQSRTRREPN